MPQKMRYRLALDLGSTSLGWALVRLNVNDAPVAIIKTGVRIFGNGREPAADGRVGESKAVARREARAMRRRRDRLLKRKARMLRMLTEHGFFPADEAARKSLETRDPYSLRAKGLDEALKPEEFARALFHINQRRGFKSNRKTDKGASDSGAMKKAIGALEQAMLAYPKNKDRRPLPKAEFDWLQWIERRNQDYMEPKPRTVGEFLNQRLTDTSIPPEQRRVRARNNGLKGGKLVYDLYIDRAMIEAEFEALWARQAEKNPALFNDAAYSDLKDCLLYQRKLRPVKPGRCTLLPEEERAPLALPSQQRFRIYQEVNHLHVLQPGLKEQPLTLEQRDSLVDTLERNGKRSFTQIKKLLGLGGAVQFNFEDPKRQELKGNTTSAILSKKEHFGDAWFSFSAEQQDTIVTQLVSEENETKLIRWLEETTGINEAQAEAIATTALPEGYGSLSAKALARILLELHRDVISCNKAVLAAGFEHHSRLNAFGEVPGRTFDTGIERIDPKTGKVQRRHAFKELPYYGEFLQRHVAFAKEKPRNDEERFGKIANPTVHIGLNQVRVVVNALIKRYGHPSEVIVEIANELKRPADHRSAGFRFGSITAETFRRYCPCAGCVNVRQAINQEKNKELRAKAEAHLGRPPSHHQMERMRIWNDMFEMSGGVAQCPYSGTPIGIGKALSSEIEVDHIFPYQKTLDDSLINKVLCVREANRIKKDRTPAQAKDDFFNLKGWRYEDILSRVSNWDRSKRFRFQEGAFEEWLGKNDTFLPRALNDTRHLSRVAYEYLSLVCPQNTRAIPGKMTAELRRVFGLNEILGLKGEKNRNDHRHHAVDACVIAVTDQRMLQLFAQASASARQKQLDRLIESIESPWANYYNDVKQSVDKIRVSHKPDHSYQGAMFDDTIYNSHGFSKRAAKIRSVIPFMARKEYTDAPRYIGKDGHPRAYKGLLPNSNYCLEIVLSDGSWHGETVSTFQAYELAKAISHRFKIPSELKILSMLYNAPTSRSGKPIVMRLTKGDTIRVAIDGNYEILQLLKIDGGGSATFIRANETNIPDRNRRKLDARELASDGKADDVDTLNKAFFQKSISAETLRSMKARKVTISPIGELRDPGFKE